MKEKEALNEISRRVLKIAETTPYSVSNILDMMGHITNIAIFDAKDLSSVSEDLLNFFMKEKEWVRENKLMRRNK